MAKLDKPPKMTDQYYIVVLSKDESILLKKEKCIKYPIVKKGCSDVVDYADVSNAVTQRFYDYHDYFNKFIATDPTNVVAYEAALAQLLDVFSKNLTSFVVQNNGVNVIPPITNIAGVEAFFRGSNNTNNSVFQGYTQHNGMNTQVRPIFNSKQVQAGSKTHLRQTARLLLPPGPGGTINLVDDSGDYINTWVYEDGIWRIKTYLFNDRLAFIIPNVIVPPTPFQPSPDVPKTC